MKNHLKVINYALCATLVVWCGCSQSSDSGSPPPSPSPTPGPTPVTIAIKSNQTIAGHPHAIDSYIPSNATSAIILLHGGGGQKEGFAYNLGLKSDDGDSSYALSTTGSEWLIANKVAAIFPQGQMVSGTLFSWTWNNYVMTSGEDDIDFLQDLVANLRSDPLFANVSKFYLAGHSNGGMMTNRMWCESPNTFDGYAALAGPPASALSSSGAHPCSPSIVKPYMAIVGDADSQLQTSGHMSDLTWSCANYNGSSPAWVSPTVLNEKLYHSNRVSMKCGGSVATPTTNGQLTTYSDCSGTLKLIVVSQTTIAGNPSGGDHCLLTINGGCSTTLAGATGLDYKTSIFTFLKEF